MLLPRAQSRRRPAALSALVAILTPLLVAMVAFAVDVAWIVSARSQLQTVADAAALAGADPLMDGYLQYQLAVNAGLGSDQQQTILNSSSSAARTLAKQYAAYNGAGGVSNLVLSDSDIVFGFTDAAGNYTASYTGFPNTITVTMRRDSNANGPLSLFFAPALGTGSSNLTAAASATVMGGTVDSLNWPGRNIPVLPMTYDVNTWNNYVATGQWPDGILSLNSSNGVPQLQIYPNLGNFAVLSLDNAHVGSHTTTWISSGMARSDLTGLTSSGLLPLSGHDANTWNWLGNSNYATTVVLSVNSSAGQTFLLPLFTPVNATLGPNYQAGVANGTLANFNVNQVVGVRVMQPPAPGHQVLIQPAAVLDPSLTFTSAAVPAGTTSYLMTTFTYPKLTR